MDTKAAQWSAEVIALLDELEGKTLDRLAKVIANPPADPEELFPAYAAISKRLKFNEYNHDLVATARQRADAAAIQHTGKVRVVYAEMMRNLFRAIDGQIDNGTNDPLDPIVRLADFGPSGTFVSDGFLQGQRLGKRNVLPEGHPCRGLDCLGKHEPLIVLGDPNGSRWRLSTLRTKTTEAVKQKKAEDNAETARREREQQLRERQAQQTPEGQQRRIADLEAEIARLKQPAT